MRFALLLCFDLGFELGELCFGRVRFSSLALFFFVLTELFEEFFEEVELRDFFIAFLLQPK